MKNLTVQCFQHVPYESAGSIEDWCREHGHQLNYTKLFLGENPMSTHQYDLLIIMGGPMSVHDDEDFPWMKAEKEAIKDAIVAKKKLLGICLGSQLIADVLGGKVYRNAEKEIGWYNISLTNAAFKLFPIEESQKQLKVFHWHGDTFSLPENAVHLAHSAACTNQAYAIQNQILAFQFHPEVKPENIKLMVQHGNEELIPGRFVQSAKTILQEQIDFKQSKSFMFQLLDWLMT